MYWNKYFRLIVARRVASDFLAYLEDLERRGQKTDFEIELQIRARRSDHEPGDKNKDCYNIDWFFNLAKLFYK
jgi:hypothetical protein